MTNSPLPTTQILLSRPFDEPASAALLRGLAHEGLRTNNVDQLRYVAAHDQTPVDVLMLLCHHQACEGELGHRPGPIALVKVMADVIEYPEAILTLGNHYYEDADQPDAVFHSFLSRHGDSRWLLRSLIEKKASTAAKAEALAEAISRHPDASELRAVQLECLNAQRAAVETDADELQRLYESDSSRIWRALAANPHTPIPLLQALAEAKAIKNAGDIRRRAALTLTKT